MKAAATRAVLKQILRDQRKAKGHDKRSEKSKRSRQDIKTSWKKEATKYEDFPPKKGENGHNTGSHSIKALCMHYPIAKLQHWSTQQ